MKPELKIELHWKENRLDHIETPQLRLRPIEENDLPAYREIFNETAMQLFRGSFSEERFRVWLNRWKAHNFSALAITDKTGEKIKVIGHAILGHGDYEGTTEKGWTEIAFILHQSYWNENFSAPEKEIGTIGRTSLGTEVVHALLAYGKELFQRKIPVPGDIDSDKLSEVKSLEIYHENGKSRAVFLPLTEIRATCASANKAALRILEQAFKIPETVGTKTEIEGTRPGFLFQIHTNDL